MSEIKPAVNAPRKWLQTEDAILIELWSIRTPLKVSVDRLPGRSVRGMEMRAVALGLERRRKARGVSDDRPAFVALRAALRTKRGTRSALAARAGVSRQTAGDFIKHFRADIHICGWYLPADGKRAPIFKAGKGVDVPEPPKQTRAAICSRWWKKLKRERPDAAGRVIARTTQRRREREGKLIRRDPLVSALFGAGGAQ